MSNYYTYYLFYLKEDLVISTNKFVSFVMSHAKDQIYAYTDNKKMAKMYCQLHNMNKFYKRVENITKDDVNNLARTAQDMIIEQKEFTTQVIRDNKIQSKNLQLAVTRWEYLCTQNFVSKIYYDCIWKSCWENPIIFKKSIQELLGRLGYLNFYSDLVHTGNVFSNLSTSPLKIDHLSAFTLLFSDIL